MRREPGRGRREGQRDPERPDPRVTEHVNNWNTDKHAER